MQTSPSRFATMTVPSSIKSRPCGDLKQADENSVTSVTVISFSWHDDLRLNLNITILFLWNAASPRRRLLGENFISSVRPKEIIVSSTCRGTEYLHCICLLSGIVKARTPQHVCTKQLTERFGKNSLHEITQVTGSVRTVFASAMSRFSFSRRNGGFSDSLRGPFVFGAQCVC